MGKRIVISADSTCDLTQELISKHQIKILPLYVNLEDKAYRDGVEITPDDIYKVYAEKKILPKTSATPIGEFTEYFDALLKEADEVIHFTIGSDLSCTYQNACIAAEEFAGRVFVVDTKNLSTGEALSILYACDLAEEGKTAEEIVAAANSVIPRVDASFIIENLEFLHKGGRCSTVAALGANLLSIKPCIEVRNGKLDVGKKYRGKFKMVLQKYVEEVLSAGEAETKRVFVTHAGCPDEIVDLAYHTVKEAGIFDEVLLTRAGCTISSHCGPDTLGILLIRKQNI